MKALILIGKPQTGKTRVAQIMAECANADGEKAHYIKLDGKDIEKYIKNPFIFSACGPKTRTIIVDGAKQNLRYELFYPMIDVGIKVQIRGMDSFNIKPRFIFTTNSEPKEIESMSFKTRFEVIHL